MRTPSAELSAQLLARAPQLLSRQGVPPFEEIAAQVGVSRATLYYYFSGQDDLVAFLLTAHVEEGAAAMAAADPGDDASGAQRLHAVLVAITAYLGERPAVCSGLLSAAASGATLQDVLALNDVRIAQPLREIIAAGIRDGSLDVPDPFDAANALLGAILMAVLGRTAGPDDPTVPDFHQALARHLVRGVSPT